jgi:hypothetical protein
MAAAWSSVSSPAFFQAASFLSMPTERLLRAGIGEDATFGARAEEILRREGRVSRIASNGATIGMSLTAVKDHQP